MRIIFIAGPAFSGKSLYVKREYPDASVIMISTYTKYAFSAESNEEIEEIAKNAQLYCAEELKRRIQCAPADGTVILEHRLLKKEGRKYYLNAVREVTDTPVELIVLDSDEETVRKVTGGEKQLASFHKYEKSKLEMPGEDEGFAKITVIHPVF